MRAGNLSEPEHSHFASRISQLRDELSSQNPEILAYRSGATYQEINSMRGEILLPIWEQSAVLSFPGLDGRDLRTGQELPAAFQALLLYYLKTADGAPLSGHWISFSELPNGRFYNLAYQGYTGKELGRAFQSDLDRFVWAAQNTGGALEPANAPHIPGDKACSFLALPRVSLLVAAWRGDEDFPSSFQILFDASVSHYLPTDVCAILGSMLTKKLIAANHLQ
jgi:Domain of unknown function (DUF3786)